jgi:hypothetical protein
MEPFIFLKYFPFKPIVLDFNYVFSLQLCFVNLFWSTLLPLFRLCADSKNGSYEQQVVESSTLLSEVVFAFRLV